MEIQPEWIEALAGGAMIGLAAAAFPIPSRGGSSVLGAKVRPSVTSLSGTAMRLAIAVMASISERV